MIWKICIFLGSTQAGRVPGVSSQTGSSRPNYNTGSNKPNYNIGSQIGGVGAPAYLSIPGFEHCLEEFTPVGALHSENCLPHRKPYYCAERAWEEIQNVFEGDCPRDPCLSTRPAEGACEPYLDRWTFDQGYIFQSISGRQKTKIFETIFESFASYF